MLAARRAPAPAPARARARARDLDAEPPVVWPAWCYTGEGGGGGGGGGGARRCARDGPPAPAPGPLPAHGPLPAAHPAHALGAVKSERLSPHDNTSTASRSRSVTPSTSSYPGTPPERGSPGAGAGTGGAPHPAPAPAPLPPPRNYSDIMRSLAARYNPHHNNDYFHRVNGSASCEPERSVGAGVGAGVGGGSGAGAGDEAPLGGLFARLARLQGGPPRLPAFPVMFDMTSTKTLLAISRLNRGSRVSRRKRTPAGSGSGCGAGGGGGGAEHCPLDLSAGGESAAKRARLSASPSLKSDCDERDRASNDERTEGGRGECLCAEARARLAAWTVDDVCDFVTSIDICAEYAPKFREQRIDGSGLPLLTEEHLTGMLQMKLGPALKLRALLARKKAECPACCPARVNGALKPEPRSNTTSPS